MVPPIPPYGEVTKDNAKEIVQSQSVSLANATSDEIFKLAEAKKELENPKLPCPYPEWQEYVEIREKLTVEEQKQMKENIGNKDADGKIEIIPMKKKIFPLTVSSPDNKSTFEGSYKDQYNETGVAGIYYLTLEMAEIEAANQGKHFITDNDDGTPQKNSKIIEERANIVINLFPGKNVVEKRMNFIALVFGSDIKESKPGYWHPNDKKWVNGGSAGYARLSRVSENSYVYGMKRSDSDALINRYPQEFPSAFVACEDC